MIEPRINFGVTCKESDEAEIGDILEFIYEKSEGKAQTIGWVRGTTCRVIVSGEINLKTYIMDEFPDAVIRTTAHLQESMDRNDNEWVSPDSYEEAKKLLASFKKNMWDDIEAIVLEDSEEQAQEKPANAPQRASKRSSVESDREAEQSAQIEAKLEERKKTAAPTSEASKKVLAAFNLLGGLTDSDGNQIKLGTLSHPESKEK